MVFLFFLTSAFCQDQARTVLERFRINRCELALHHPSLRSPTATMIHYSNSPHFSRGGKVPIQATGLILRPRNDSGCLAYERPNTAGTPASPAASSTFFPPAGARPSPLPARSVSALSTGNNPAATLHRTAMPSAPLRPKAHASWCFLVC